MGNNNDGGKNDFYNIEGCIDLDDIAERLELRADEFNCIKAIFGIAIERKTGGSRHSGTGAMRDSNKLLHYSKRINKRIAESGSKMSEAQFSFATPTRREGKSRAFYMALHSELLKHGEAYVGTLDVELLEEKFREYLNDCGQEDLQLKLTPLKGGVEIKVIGDKNAVSTN